MPTKPLTILSIDPGTKELGVALFEGAELRYYAVKTFKRRKPTRTLLAAITRYVVALVRAYRPQVLALEQTLLNHEGAALLPVAAAVIKQAARRHGLAVYEYAPAEVRRALCQDKRATKRETTQLIAGRYPELARRLKQPSKWEALYWAHVFDAVALGLHCQQQIKEL